MTEVTYKQLANWTRRCNGDAVWNNGSKPFGQDCGKKNKTCKDKGRCIGHYGVPYPDECPICKSSDNLEICGLEDSRAWEMNLKGDELNNVYICCNEDGCNTILVNYMIEGEVNDYSDVIYDYEDMVKQLFGRESK